MKKNRRSKGVRLLSTNVGNSGVYEHQRLNLNTHTKVLDNDTKARKDAENTKRKAAHACLDIPSDACGGTHATGCSDSDHDDPSTYSLNNVLDGSVNISSSHAGGELSALLDSEGERTKRSRKRRRQRENRTRRDQTQRRNEAFEGQMEALVAAFMVWGSQREDGNDGVPSHSQKEKTVQGIYKVSVIDCFKSYTYECELREGDAGVPAALLSQGLIPCAPFTPSTVFTVRTMELYHSLYLRCPHLALQPFIKGMCDMQGLPFSRGYSDKFTIAYDLYLQLVDEVEKKVLDALKRDSPNWRLKNACPACTYRLEGEPKLVYAMLVTMDGNDSLKRVARRLGLLGDAEEGEDTRVGPSRNVEDKRSVSSTYYLTRAQVDAGPANGLADDGNGENESGETTESACAGRWHNMDPLSTSRAWGIFDETGLFLSLCRHGFALVAADMVQSGEQSKYPLAVVEKLLDAFGDDVGCGYDIGCRFGTTLDTSPLGPRARKHNFRCLVGSFHGHAHNRLCQLLNLATYVEGMGLEDLEGCERFFSKSNALAAALRYATVFHRRQKIDQYLRHVDSMETMANLSKFLVDNYIQALDILRGRGDLVRLMNEHGIKDSAVFSTWLEEERVYLSSLSKEPPEDTLKIDYYQRLVDLASTKKTLDELRSTFLAHDPIAPVPKGRGRRKQSPEAKLRHATELYDKNLAAVIDLEKQLDISERWVEGSEEWVSAAVMHSKRRYMRCLDNLERLVVSRLFELSKVNMSQTGYKLRKHIAKSLQTRSQAIRNALEKYNAAAAALKPRAPKLTWDQVVEYAFLADFDLLRDSRQDVRNRPWAQPVPRAIMHQWFKIERAKEEVERVKIEIRRVVTFIADERRFLARALESLTAQDPTLAVHLSRHIHRRTLFFDTHLKRFRRLEQQEPGLNLNLSPGVPVSKDLRPVPVNAVGVAATDPASRTDASLEGVGRAGESSGNSGGTATEPNETDGETSDDSDSDDSEGEAHFVTTSSIIIALEDQPVNTAT
ncbi:hypothetical protein D9611_005927 [Ephemerocybe angulata]|uniref:CxC1-like cysteine cluster associated with KDZ transposases domain-containing protein n=1 Tax=Ephemerocybe angulata TaxID=980116 RepID=A0A8H5CGD5_9AGAR|nr:hypothetical protein D9611_005927 [Tulosesus angulatus]